MDEQVTDEQVVDGTTDGQRSALHDGAAQPTALESTALESTGDAAVDEALSRLVDLTDQPLRSHVAVLDAVHGALQDRLADAEG